jgi:glycine/D-amino acid oxidase-like deaminating enzyme
VERADVLIVGGGLAGTSVAWWLGARARTLIVDQGDQLGQEASAQNAGMLRRLASDRVERALAVRSAELHIDPPGSWSVASPYRKTGAVIGLERAEGGLDEAVRELRGHGVCVESIGPEDYDRVAPALVGAPLEQAWYLPDEGLLDAHTLVQGFWTGARSTGAQLWSGAVVESLELVGGRVVGVRTSKGPVRADVVVLAAGAWGAGLARTVGLDRPLVPLRRHLLQTAADPRAVRDHAYCWIDDVGLYARPEAGGWLISPCDETIDAPSLGPGSRGSVEPLFRAIAEAKLGWHLPSLAEVRFSGGWTGLRTFAPDRRPWLGPDPELEGLWWAAGLGGFGVTCSFAIGEVVAARLLGGDVPYLQPKDALPSRALTARVPEIGELAV